MRKLPVVILLALLVLKVYDYKINDDAWTNQIVTFTEKAWLSVTTFPEPK